MGHRIPSGEPRVLVAVLLAVVLGCTAGRPALSPSSENIPDLRAELEEDPGAVEVMVRLGAAYREAGQLAEARTMLQQARRRAPGHAPAAFYLGLVHEDLEQYELAREAYRSFLRLDGGDRLRTAAERRLTLLRRRALVTSLRRSLEREAELRDRQPEEGTVAVFPFRYEGSDPRYEPLGRALAEFLVTDLSRTERLTVLERSRVQLLLDEMELSDSRYADPATAVRSGRLLGAADLVQGVVGGGEELLAVEASVVDARRPPPEQTDPAFSDRGPVDRVFELEADIALSVYRTLGIELTASERASITGHPTESLDAFLAFGRGLIAQDSANFAAAARHYREAARLDPGFSQASERAELADQLSAAAAVDVDGLAGLAASEGMLGRRGADLLGPRSVAVDRTRLAPFPFERDPVTEVLGVEGLGSNPGFFRIIITPPGEQP